jgi:hypothetical protein
MLVEEADIESGIDWGQFFSEAKFWLYIVSWLLKIVCIFYVKGINRRQKITDKEVKFVGI